MHVEFQSYWEKLRSPGRGAASTLAPYLFEWANQIDLLQVNYQVVHLSLRPLYLLTYLSSSYSPVSRAIIHLSQISQFVGGIVQVCYIPLAQWPLVSDFFTSP